MRGRGYRAIFLSPPGRFLPPPEDISATHWKKFLNPPLRPPLYKTVVCIQALTCTVKTRSWNPGNKIQKVVKDCSSSRRKGRGTETFFRSPIRQVFFAHERESVVKKKWYCQFILYLNQISWTQWLFELSIHDAWWYGR